MVRIKDKLVGAAIVALAGVSGPATTTDGVEVNKESGSNGVTTAKSSKTKRQPSKIYHNFKEIPEITDADVHLYSKREYTYIMNAEVYQKTGRVEIKRVLKGELSELSILSPIYYRECKEYQPKPNEDSKICYDLNPSLVSSSGTYKGPTQMNDDALKNFMKYLLANPKTRKYMVKHFRSKDSRGVEQAAQELERLFFDERGKPRATEDCNGILANKGYTNIITKAGVTQTYLQVVKEMPKSLLIKELENYQLRYSMLCRPGKPQEIISEVARRSGYKTRDNQPDATRVPMATMGAAYCHVNWKGNGLQALTLAKRSANPASLAIAKSMVDGKGPKGVAALAETTIMTPKIIAQYEQMGLSGAKELMQKYKMKVDEAERRTRILAFKQIDMSGELKSERTSKLGPIEIRLKGLQLER